MAARKIHPWLLAAVLLLILPASLAVWWMLPDGSAADSGEARDDESPRLVLPEKAPDKTEDESAATGETAGTALLPDVLRTQAEALRTQGITKKAVREIMASRITAAFETRRMALRNQSHASRSDTALQPQLDALSREQGALIELLFGPEEKQKPEQNAGTHIFRDTVPPQMPAAMADALPVTVRTEEQAATLEKVRADFVAAIGGEGQDPASHEYRRRWIPAQSEADQRFRLFFGDNAFVQHQLQAAQKARQREGAAGLQ